MELEKRIFDIISSKVIVKYAPKYNICNNIRAVTLESESYNKKKTKFFAYYGVPQNTKKTLPAIVLVHGGGGHAYHCWVRYWMERGFAAIAMDTTGYMPTQKNAGFIDNEQDKPFWSREWNQDFAEVGYIAGPDNDKMNTAGRAPDEQWMLHAVSAVIRSHNFLRQQPEIDNDKIGICGISWGGVITSIVLGYDTRFAFAIPIYGSGYLGMGLSELDEIFKTQKVKNEWLAESRFNSVKCPVLWMAWNDDSSFSVQSNTLSYEHTVKNNSDTRLSIVNRMFHSHERAWVREEPYYFAESVVKHHAQMPYLCEQNNGFSFHIEVVAEEKIHIKKVTLYYIIKPMAYEKFDKFGYGENTFMTEKWKTQSLNLTDNVINGRFPNKVRGYYVEVLFSVNDKELTVTTGYKEI